MVLNEVGGTVTGATSSLGKMVPFSKNVKGMLPDSVANKRVMGANLAYVVIGLFAAWLVWTRVLPMVM